MNDSFPTVRQGDIIWAEVVDPESSNPKKRPLIVVSQNSDILNYRTFIAVACTTNQFADNSNLVVKLPGNSHGHPITRLFKETYVKCNWKISFKLSDNYEIKGKCPTRELIEILKILKTLS